NCSTYLDREWKLLKRKRIIVALGKIAWDATLALAKRNDCTVPKPQAAFGHGVKLELSSALVLVGSYHVSQQNTFTGKLTPAMFDAMLRGALQLAKRGGIG